ncbi:Hypothetical predicted protein [Octopus vulgaris]|uniref:VWFA domain-containing protein n=1 Tax=Octopus vulgaris TaxID=6645 RepID=A0AA36BW27_OCTVU|nr:Hypothetical predicted protein [Octopus vulgaris]
MTIKYLLFVAICLGIARDIYAAVDLTLKSGETSNATIDATIRKIRDNCILAQDYYFLRRLAVAQMNSIAATTGGIWRVTSAQLTTVQSACNGILKTNCSKAKTEFNVDVSALTMSDLQIPLYSGLAMSLFILKSVSPVPLQKAQQAQSWKTHINSNGDTTKFVTWSNELEQLNDCTSAQVDLLFVIDSSGSVGGPNFQKTKTFLNNVVSNLDISQNETRVAVLRFSSKPYVMFNFDKHSTKAAVTSAIAYNGGGTNTDSALDLARTSVFANTTRKSVAVKVLVLVTDGKSSSENKTVAAAQKLKDAGVTIFTIGVVNPKVSELIASASEPSCTHFINLKSYSEIDFIVREIESKSCKAIYVMQNDTVLPYNPIPKTNKTKEQVVDVTKTTQSNSGTIITVSVQCGVVTVYGAYNNSQPSLASYDYMTNATDTNPGNLYLVKQTLSSTLYLTIISRRRFDLKISACNNPQYNVSFDATDPTIRVTCRQNNKEVLCSSDDLKDILGKNIPYPCTKENRIKGLYVFPYPNKPEKYLECGSQGKLTIVLCPKDQTFDATLKTFDLASMPARSVGDQVACWFPEVSVADHKTIRIAELQQPGSLLVAGTITVASMYAMEAPSMSSNMPIEITSHKEKVPVVRR